MPLLIFLVVFWIGLRGEGGSDKIISQGTMSNAAMRMKENYLGTVPDSMVQQQQRRGEPVGNLRGREAEPKGESIQNESNHNPPPEPQETQAQDDNAQQPPPLPPDEPEESTEHNHVAESGKKIPPRNDIPANEPIKSDPRQMKTITKQAVEKPAHPGKAIPDKKVFTLFLEPRSSLDESAKPLPPRKTSAVVLKAREFPEVQSCLDIPQRLPVNHFPDEDPFLPWIHDYFVSHDRQSVQFVAANKRRCETGEGKESAMAYLQAQVSLFQPVPVARIPILNHTLPTQYRLAAPDDPNLVAAETRFQCRFHRHSGEEWITFSRFNFNYEYVNWRKRGKKPMFSEMGTDLDASELSQLLFYCPIPEDLKSAAQVQNHGVSPSFWVDIVPIRTPTRKNSVLLTENHTGPLQDSELPSLFDASLHFGQHHVLPSPVDAGRLANFPVCMPSTPEATTKPNTLVGCTWSSASYRRRGDDTLITDTTARLREWLHFNRLVGMDHVYLYDNSPLLNASAVSPFVDVVQEEFSDFVTHVPWPAQVCNNHKLKDKVPGERSSQYAAEASCLLRYGSLAEWMTFLDVDEYLIPRSDPLDWKPILTKHKDDSILNFRSSRGKPRLDMMNELSEEESRKQCDATHRHFPEKAKDACVEPRRNETFLKVFNCDSSPPPRPVSFVKSQKQIVRPDVVLQHFVHNTTVTLSMASYYSNAAKTDNTRSGLPKEQVYIDEITEGYLLHAKTVPPPETMLRSHHCQTGSNAPCPMGHICPASTAVNATLQRKNSLVDSDGKFCNCFVDPHVENKIVPLLESLLQA